MLNARDLRLHADYEQVHTLAANSGGRLVIESTKGHPPDEYVLIYHCRSIEALKDNKPVYRTLNRVRIKLPARYPVPSAAPIVEMQTPIFNPHVYTNRVVCMGSWQTTEYLEDVVLRIGAMIQFDRRYMNVLDPANEQAMFWVTRNLLLLPTDNIAFLGADPPVGSPPHTPLDPNALPEIGDLMRREDQADSAELTEAELIKPDRKAEYDEPPFAGLKEDTSLIWHDLD